MRVIFGMLVVLVAASASAYSVQIVPPAPAAGDPVVISVTHALDSIEPAGFVRTGNVIELRFTDGNPLVIDPLPIEESRFDLGSLPAGTYTVRIVNITNAPPVILQTFSFAVADATAPALDPRGIGVLAIALATSAFLALRRTMP